MLVLVTPLRISLIGEGSRHIGQLSDSKIMCYNRKEGASYMLIGASQRLGEDATSMAVSELALKR